MRAVRQWMIKPFKKKLPLGSFLLFPILGILSSCNPTELTGNGVRSNVIANDGSMNKMAYIYPDSPYILGGPSARATNPNMGSFLERTPRLVTNESNLTTGCQFTYNNGYYFTNIFTPNCIRSLKNQASEQVTPVKADGTFIFPANTPEFYQANTLYHLRSSTSKFLDKLGRAYGTVRYSVDSYTVKSIPSYLETSRLFWFQPIGNSDNKLFQNDFLTSYAQCDLNNNSMFSPVGPTLCFGYMATIPGFLFVQDPTIVYHELGHAFVSIMMNLRNGTEYSLHEFRSNLGSYGYNEAGALNEGIADYFSYMMNKRESMGEFGLGTTAKQSRPLTEAHPMHITGIDETSEGRLSYPQFVNYDPNTPTKVKEAVHYAGQITSHYLVALTKSFKNQCGLSNESDGGHDTATTWVTLLLAETLSELGDLKARGIDQSSGASFPEASSIFFNNLDSTSSYLWTQVVNPVTYRRFYQVFAKNINKYISGNLCSGFTTDISEKLLDDYGLLLFKTYNDNGNSTKSRVITHSYMDPNYATPGLTPVDEDNRRKSVLVSKQLVELAEKSTEKPDRATYYIVDDRVEMDKVLKELLFKGFTVPLSKAVASTSYNNGNLKISPGEIIAIVPNLFNKSNSTMAGVQLLATDWDHVEVTDPSTGNFKPCKVDDVTTVDQGAEAGSTCLTTDTSYRRLLYNSSTKTFPTSAAAPVCLVELPEGNSARWVSQNEYRKKQGMNLEDKDCLGFAANGVTDNDFTMNPHECLIRFLPGANTAHYSKIESQKTYTETLFTPGTMIKFNPGNSLIMEINKWVQPGTKFRCRLRARFSNCSDCYNNDQNGQDDFLDYEYNGADPYKVINFDFTVND